MGDYISDGKLAPENVTFALPLEMVDGFVLEVFGTIFLIPQYNWGWRSLLVPLWSRDGKEFCLVLKGNLEAEALAAHTSTQSSSALNVIN